MGRKSRADERRDIILAAFERCIPRYGINASLEQIAAEAGVKRSLIRHYLGNRDEVVEQLIARIAEDYPARIAALLAPAQPTHVDDLLDLFFGEELITPEWDAIITAVLSTAQGEHEQAKRRLGQMLIGITAQVAGALAQLAPQAAPEARYAAAYTLICLAHANESLLTLGIAPSHTLIARSQAARIVRELGSHRQSV